jgi:hypothetical protein
MGDSLNVRTSAARPTVAKTRQKANKTKRGFNLSILNSLLSLNLHNLQNTSSDYIAKWSDLDQNPVVASSNDTFLQRPKLEKGMLS